MEGQISFIKTVFNLNDFTHLNSRKIWRLANLFLGEFLATGLKMFLFCSTVQAALFNKSQEHLTVAIGGGFAVGSVVMMFQHISGPHINPAISLAAVIMGHMSLAMGLFYACAQCFGSFVAASLIGYIMPSDADLTKSFALKCCSVPNVHMTDSQLLVTEMVATSVLILALCAAIDKRNANKHDSLSLKFAMVIIAIAIPVALYSGCGINPARSFGPALYNNYWDKHWIYWLGPLLGSFISATTYRIVFDASHMDIGNTSGTTIDSASVKLKNQHHSKYDDDV